MKGPGMNLFSSRKKFNVSERDPTYKVRYLGNIQTSMMRGEGCTDKAAGILWSNFLKNGGGLDMKLTICATGLKAVTKEQGITDYRAHRISYCIAHPEYPKLFLWVYRHEGKRMKVELRCHAVLLRKVEKARAMALQLHEKLSSALSEFVREKTRRQNTRLTLQRTNSLPSNTGDNSGQPLRRKMLSTAQNFKPSVDRSASAPKLGAISEDCEPEPDIMEEDEEEDEDDEVMAMTRFSHKSRDDSCLSQLSAHSDGDLDLPPMHDAFSDMDPAIFDLEMGNDVTALQADADVQFQIHQSQLSSEDEDDGSESGFSEQDASGSTGSSASCASENGHILDCEEALDEGMGSLCYLPSPGGLDSEPVIFASAL